MRKVIGIGETILDIIFRDEQPIGAVPGGSMFNGLISLGRAGLNASFISETGDDRVGKRIISFMEQNHVDASNISVYPEAKSPVSLAFLNESTREKDLGIKPIDERRVQVELRLGTKKMLQAIHGAKVRNKV